MVLTTYNQLDINHSPCLIFNGVILKLYIIDCFLCYHSMFSSNLFRSSLLPSLRHVPENSPYFETSIETCICL
jgi:hypothetical protein